MMTVDSIRRQAKALKGNGYDETIKRLRMCYANKQDALLCEALQKKYPRTWHKMDRVPIALVPHVAETDATVYAMPAQRGLTFNDNTADGIQQATQDMWQAHLRAAKIDSFMSQAEGVLAIAGTVFVRLSWHAARNCIALQCLWPCDVDVVPDDNFDGNADTIKALVFEHTRNAQNKSDARLEVWQKTDNPATPWLYELQDGKGTVIQASAAKRLPFVMMHKRLTNGAPVVDADEDLLAQAMALSVSATYLQDIAGKQAHTDRVYKGNKAPANMIAGTGQIVPIGKDEDLYALNYSPNFEGALQVQHSALRTLALTRQQPPDAYTVGEQLVMSGVSRLIANQPSIRATQKRAAILAQIETEHLLPLMTAIISDNNEGSIFAAHAQYIAGYVCKPSIESEVITSAERNELTLRMLAEGLLTRAQALVRLGAAPTLEAAEAMLPPPVDPLAIGGV